MATKKLSVEQFTLQAILNLRNLDKSPGIHVVFSGFNAAFREYFPNKDVKKEMRKLVDDKKIIMVPRRGGPMIYFPDEGPADASAEDALDKILGRTQ